MPNTGHQTNDFVPYDSSVHYDQDQEMPDPSPTASQESDDSSVGSDPEGSVSASQGLEDSTPTETTVSAYYQRFNTLSSSFGHAHALSNTLIPQVHIIIISIEHSHSSSDRRVVPRAFVHQRTAIEHAIALFNRIFEPVPGRVLHAEQPGMQKWGMILENGVPGIVRVVTLPLVEVRADAS